MAITLAKTIDDGGLWAALSDHAAGLGAFHGSRLGNPFLTKEGVTRELLAYGADLHPPVVALHPLDASKLTQDYQQHYVYHRDNLTGVNRNRTDAAIGAPIVSEWSIDRQAWHELDS